MGSTCSITLGHQVIPSEQIQMLHFSTQGGMVESPMVMEKMGASSAVLNSQTKQQIQTLAILLVPGSIEGTEEPKARRTRKTEDKANVRQRESKQ